MGRPRKKPTADGRWLCQGCWQWKFPEQYYKRSASLNGLCYRCKDCMDAAQKKRMVAIATERHYQAVLAEWPSAPEKLVTTLADFQIRRSRMVENFSTPEHIDTLTHLIMDLERILRTYENDPEGALAAWGLAMDQQSKSQQEAEELAAEWAALGIPTTGS
jgi:hypothetical protein